MRYCITKGENAFKNKPSSMLYFAGMKASDIKIPVFSTNIKDVREFTTFGHAEAYAKKHNIEGVINRIHKGK